MNMKKVALVVGGFIIVIALIASLVGGDADIPEPEPTATVAATVVPTDTQVVPTTTATLEPTATPEPTLTPTPSLEWYEGGTLHEGTIGEWKRASAHDWLATAADFAYLLLQDQGHDLTSIGGLDGLRPYAEDIVTCVNESTVGLDALDDSLKTAETALLCVTLMGSQWGIRD